MTVLVDSCIIIDALRQKPEAMRYIRALDGLPAVSVVSVAELRAGQKSPGEANRIDQLLASSAVLPIDWAVAERAGAFMKLFRKSHQLDIADALIAATAAERGLALATLNLKHFPMFPHLAAPY
jgi:hypothetical protein